MKESGYYPPGAEFDSSAPYNQTDVSEKNFEVTCSQSLSRTVTITTNNYIPGASGIDYEPDGEGGYYASGWQDPDDTSNTDWGKEYGYDHFTPLQLIQILREYVEKDLSNVDNIAKETNQNKAFIERKLTHLIDECDCWQDDETEYIVES
jgi:hypothetical protein